MHHPAPAQLGLSLAWEFSTLLQDTFKRNREEVRHKRFPVIGPVPPEGRRTLPLEGRELKRPFIYVAFDGENVIKYVGVVTAKEEDTPFERWIRPCSLTGREYWAHGTNKRGKSTVEWIAETIRHGKGPVRLYFTDAASARVRVEERASEKGYPMAALRDMTPETFIERELESAWVYRFQPEWNVQKKRQRPKGSLVDCCFYWE